VLVAKGDESARIDTYAGTAAKHKFVGASKLSSLIDRTQTNALQSKGTQTSALQSKGAQPKLSDLWHKRLEFVINGWLRRVRDLDDHRRPVGRTAKHLNLNRLHVCRVREVVERRKSCAEKKT
jgi:hypothetical protein